MTYSIAEVAKKHGIAAHTLRYYDKEGLLSYVDRNAASIRVFKESDFVWLNIIHCLKESGVAIKQIKTYLEWCQQGDISLQTRLDFMQKHKKYMQDKINALKKHMELIDYKIWYYETAIEAGTSDIHKKDTEKAS